MKTVARFILFLSTASVIGLISCASAGKINEISVGMTKSEAIQRLGKPASVSATNGVEYLNYRFSETGDDAFYGRTTPYYVRIINGRVEAYGRMGDFDSTKTPTVRVEHDSKVETTINRGTSGEDEELSRKLRELKKMKDEGTITGAEYGRMKKRLFEKWTNRKNSEE